MATEFVCEIGSGLDYSDLNAWEADVGCDLTAASTLVLEGVNFGIVVGDTVTGAMSTETATVVGVTDTQILVTSVSGALTAGELLYDGDVEHNFDVADGESGDTAIAVAEIVDAPVAVASDQTIADFTCDADNYVIIRPTAGDEASASSFDTAKAYLSVGSVTKGIYIRDAYVRVIGLQILLSGSSDICYGIDVYEANVSISKCRIKDQATGTSSWGIVVRDEDCTINNTIAEMGHGASSSTIPIYANSGTTGLKVHNSLIYGDGSTANGFRSAADTTAAVTNTIVGNCADNWLSAGTDTVTYCLSKTDTPAGATNKTATGAWTEVFTDPANGDFTLLGSDWQAMSAGISTTDDASVPTTDIDGNTRHDTSKAANDHCDIGASEYQGSTEYVCVVDTDDGGGNEYTTLATAEAAMDNDLTLGTIKVFAGTNAGLVVGNTVTQATSGAKGTVIGVSDTQLLLSGVNTASFNNSDNIVKDSDTEYFTPTTAGDAPKITISCTASAGTSDDYATSLSFAAAVINEINYIEVAAASGDEALATGYDVDRYRLEFQNSDAAAGIDVVTKYMRFTGLQMEVTGSNATNGTSVLYVYDGHGETIINGCRFYDRRTAATSGAVYVVISQDRIEVLNCIFDNWKWGSSTHVMLYWHSAVGSSSGSLAYNNIISGPRVGTAVSMGAFCSALNSVTLKNNVFMRLDNDINGGASAEAIAYNASEDEDGTNDTTLGVEFDDWDDCFTDYKRGDFSIPHNSPLRGRGIGTITSIGDTNVPATCMSGNSRIWPVCDIGAEQFDTPVEFTLAVGPGQADYDRLASAVLAVTGLDLASVADDRTIVVDVVDGADFIIGTQVRITARLGTTYFLGNLIAKTATQLLLPASSNAKVAVGYGRTIFQTTGATTTCTSGAASAIVVCECATTGAVDSITAAAELAGTTSATNYYKISAHAGHRATLNKWDTSKYILSLDVTGGTFCQALATTADYTMYDGLQIEFTGADASYDATGIWINTGASNSIIRGCRFKTDTGFEAQDLFAIYLMDSAVIENCVFDQLTGHDTGYTTYAIYTGADVGATRIYNNTVVGGGSGAGHWGIRCNNDANVTVKNCIVCNHPAGGDFASITNATIDYCATADNDGTNAVNLSGVDIDDIFLDADNGDYRLAPRTVYCMRQGVGPSTDIDVYATDADGNTRGGTLCDIGAHEFSDATEFVCVIDPDSGTGYDFASLAGAADTGWEATVQCDLTSRLTKVLQGAKSGAVARTNTVTGGTSGATATVVFCTSTQLLVTGVTDGPFADGEVLTSSGGGTFTATDGGAPAIAVAECTSSGGTAEPSTDASFPAVAGWTTDRVHYVVIRAADSDKASAQAWDATKYRIVATNAGGTAYGLYASQDYTRIEGLQIQINCSVANSAYGIWIHNNSRSIVVDSCRIYDTSTLTGALRGIAVSIGVSNIAIRNCVIEMGSSGVNEYGILAVNAGQAHTLYIYNSVISGNGSTTKGILTTANASNTIKNCAIRGTANDIDSGSKYDVIEYCATDDEGATGLGMVVPSNWDKVFEDASNGDFRIRTGITTNLTDAGLGPDEDSDVPIYDMDGDLRTGSTCDIGVDEGQSASSTEAVFISMGIGI